MGGIRPESSTLKEAATNGENLNDDDDDEINWDEGAFMLSHTWMSRHTVEGMAVLSKVSARSRLTNTS